MSHHTVAWRLFLFNWMPLGGFAALLALSLGLMQMRIAGALLPLTAAASFGILAFLFALYRHRTGLVPVFIFGAAAQLLLVTTAAGPLTYVAAAAALPLQDAPLAAMDRMLGLDWAAYLSFVHERPSLILFFTVAYDLIFWPMFAVPILLGLKRHHDRLHQFTLALLVTFLVTIAVSVAVPAFGPYQPLAPADYALIQPTAFFDHMREFPRLRDGSLRVIDLPRLVGVVTFPSFHAAAAVLYLWGFWPLWWMRPAAVICSGGMLLATPICGDHYFVDIVAGIGVAALGIAAAAAVSRRLADPSLGPAPAIAPVEHPAQRAYQ